MKYAMIEYDFNGPMNKVLKEPLDSDYGIAVRCWKNGSIVDGALSVDGLSATATIDTWQLFDLSTGSTPCKKQLEVFMSKDTDTAEIVASHEEIDTWGGDYEVQATISLSSYAGLELSRENLQTPIGKVTSEFPEGQPTITDWNELITIYADGVGGSNIIQWNKTTGWSNVSVSLTENSVIRADYHYPADATKSTLTINIQVSSGEGLSATFPLYVNETDLGYINVEEN